MEVILSEDSKNSDNFTLIIMILYLINLKLIVSREERGQSL